jgi:hypothetical protein
MLDLPQNHADAHRLFMVHPENEYEIMKEKKPRAKSRGIGRGEASPVRNSLK